ncbi:MAG: TonB-dependent receptor domain-containing protein [Chitinophagaceae bacterium]
MRSAALPQYVLSLLTFLITTVSTFAQTNYGKISGRIVDPNNKPISGATIIIAGNKGIATGVDGRFTLSVPYGKYEITITAVGFVSKTVSDIAVKAGAVEELDIVLDIKANKLDDVTVKTSARRETTNALIAYQKNTNTVAAVVSAEAIRRSPDRNTGEVLKRTPGASIQEGRFLIVRGLADRYNQAMLNGVLLGSTEPDRKAFSFDLIPANMIENIIINKAFVPELPGEWAGGLVQVNTRDIPAKNFFNIQIGAGVNTQAHFRDFYRYKGGKTDWLGIDDGTRTLPSSYISKNRFDILSPADKVAIGKEMPNIWSTYVANAPVNGQLQLSGGFNAKMKGSQQLGGVFGFTYQRNTRHTNIENNGFNFQGGGIFNPDYNLVDVRYSEDVQWGALGSLTYQLNNNHKLSAKTIFNINSTDFVSARTGNENFTSNLDRVRGSELGFRQNTFWNTQVVGDHNIYVSNKQFKLRWYGSFGLLDGFTPDQRRIYYVQAGGAASGNPFLLQASDVLSQKSGNRFFQNLNDYIYTGGADLSHTVTAFGYKQTIKGGYMFQIRDRLFDAKPFSIFLPRSNNTLRALTEDVIFSPQNFGDGSASSNLFAFDAIRGTRFRYIANTILNAAYVQFDNQFTDKLKLVWGARLEDYDQLVGSTRKSDPRFNNVRVRDFLPGVNLTYKVNQKVNIRLTGSQTVVRPELRELATFEYYDFELNAAVQGTPTLERTKVTNLDLRYELYPSAGEVFTLGAFYKYFDKPIEMLFNYGPGGASFFNYQNPASANAFGVELEARKKLDFLGVAFNNFTLQANAAYIHSRVNDARLGLDRPLQGQSPYVLNMGLLYDNQKHGISATLLYNQIGRRVAFVGSEDQPDTYEAPRPVFDFQLTKKLYQNKMELRLNVQDILNSKLYFYQNVDGNTNFNKTSDPIRFARQFGTNISFTIGYAL